MVPLPVILHRNRYLPAIAEVISRTVTAQLPIIESIAGGDRVIAPLVLPTGKAHGVQLRFGNTSETPPARPVARGRAWNVASLARVRRQPGQCRPAGLLPPAEDVAAQLREAHKRIEFVEQEAEVMRRAVGDLSRDANPSCVPAGP